MRLLKHHQPDIVIKRLPDTFIPKVFLFVQQLRLSTILAVAFHDGSLEFRNRISMEILEHNNVREQVSGLSQVGFGYVQDTPRTNH